MNFRMVHTNFNVFDLSKSLAFYQEALGLHEARRKEAADGSYIIVFLQDNFGQAELELTWLKDRSEPYDLGDQEFHICYRCDDYDSSFKKHQEIWCVAYVNEKMGVYFITDPDGYWIEITPERSHKN